MAFFIIDTIYRFLILLIMAHWIMSYFVSPYHPAREFVSRLLEPLLAPIRQVLPSMSGLDFSPMVLWILVSLIRTFLLNALVSL